MKPVFASLIISLAIAFSLYSFKVGYPCHPNGDIYPCSHPRHPAGDVGPCGHYCTNGYGNTVPCHPAGDVYPCTHALHYNGDVGPCTHICY